LFLIRINCSIQTGQLGDLIVIKQTVLVLDNVEKDIFLPSMSKVFLGNTPSDAFKKQLRNNRIIIKKFVHLKKNMHIRI
jgi:hypothetical protein|tara:strand:- start:210 stop:446 length:237 start_codon:yes stop_codon:yes gene_type:complete